MCDKIERGTFLCMFFVFTLYTIRNLIMSFKRYISEHLRKNIFEKKRPYAIYGQHDEFNTITFFRKENFFKRISSDVISRPTRVLRDQQLKSYIRILSL